MSARDVTVSQRLHTEHEDVLRSLHGQRPGVAGAERRRVVGGVGNEGSRGDGVRLEVGLGGI